MGTVSTLCVEQDRIVRREFIRIIDRVSGLATSLSAPPWMSSVR